MAAPEAVVLAAAIAALLFSQPVPEVWAAGLPGMAVPEPLASSPAPTLPMLGQDAIPLPPLLRHVASAAGTYHLVLTLGQAAAGDRRTTAELFAATGDRCQRLWTLPLPHSYGPRLGLVNDSGTVVLLDDWINVASPRAIVVLGRGGDILAQHSFDDIVAVTDQSRSAVVEQATQGFWLAGSPRLSQGGDRLTIPAAGGQIQVDLATGELSFSRGGS